MKIAVRDIPEAGLELEEDLDARALDLEIADRLAYATPAHVAATVVRHEGGVRVSGEVKARVRWVCARCLEPYDRPLRQAFDLLLENAPDGIVDPTDRIREEVVLSYDVQSVCKRDCKGLCARCGSNLNEGPCGCDGRGPDSSFDQLKDHIR